MRAMYGANGGFGGPQAAAKPAIPPIMLDADMSRISSAMTAPLMSFLAPVPPGAVSPIAGMKRDSIVACQNGDYPLALALHFADMVIDPETASDAFSAVQYNSNLRRPVWAIRFGVALAVRGDETSERSPIQPGKAAAGGFAGGPGGGFGGPPNDFGEMEQRMAAMQGQFGGPPDGMGFGMGPNGSPKANRAVPAGPAMIERPMLDPAVDDLFEDTVGLVGQAFVREYESRYSAGKFGAALTDVRPRPEKKRPSPSSRGAKMEADDGSVHPTAKFAEVVDEVEEPTPCWKPGLLFLGELDSAEAIAQGRRLGLDFVFQFDVVLKESNQPRNRNSYGATRSGPVENTSRIRLYHVDSGKSLISSKAMSNTEATNQVTRRQYSDNEAYVDDKMRAFWLTVDRTTKLKPMPPLNPDSARRRVGQLFADSNGDVMRMLSEVRLYQSHGWLTPDEVETAFDILGGAVGLNLLYAPELEQRSEVRKMIVKAIRDQRINRDP